MRPYRRCSPICNALWLLVFATLAMVIDLDAQSTLIPVTTRRDMVFDYAGHYLYITTSNGRVERYNLSSGQIDRTYNLGGSLNGADIARNDSFLLVGQNNLVNGQGTVQKLDLSSGAVTSIPYTPDSDEGGGWDVSIDANGRALVTSTGPNWCWVRQLDPTSNTFTLRDDATEEHYGGGIPQSVSHNVQLRRSADGTRIACYESVSSGRAIFIYNTASDKFSPYLQAENASPSGASLNRNGTLLGTQLNTFINHTASIDTVPGLHFVHGFKGFDGDVVFDAVKDVVYAVNSATDQIVAYDTTTLVEQFRLNIGEDLVPPWRQFGAGTLVASPDGRYLALETVSGIRLFSVPQSPTTPSPTPSPSLADRRDMVFDHSGNYLYVGTSTGFVMRYNLGTNSVDHVYDLGGSLYGIDIAPDDSFLLVCQDNVGVHEAIVQKLDLITGQLTNITFSRADGFQLGGWDVAIAANGIALLTTQIYGIGWSDLRKIDLATNEVPSLFGFPGLGQYHLVGQNSALNRSADYTRLYLLSNESSGPILSYNAVTNAFETPIQTNRDLDFASGAVNRNGTLLATRFDNYISLDSASNFSLKHIFAGDGGIAFDAVTDTLYATNRSTDELVAYDTTTFRQKFRIDFGENLSPGVAQFDTGTLVASHDGHHVAIATSTGIKVLTVSPPPSVSNPPPPLTNPRGMVFDHSGRYLYITTATGLVYPYNISTGETESPFEVGGSLNGVDIAGDDSFLIIAESGAGLKEGTFHKLDLATGNIIEITYPRGDFEIGGWDVAIAANGLALTSREFSGSYAPIREIDLDTNLITVRQDAPLFYSNLPRPRQTQIHRSADRTRLYFLESQLTGTPAFTYSSLTNTFGPTVLTNANLGAATGAVSRDGSLLATRDSYAVLRTAPDLASLHTFTALDSGIAFDAAIDVLYGVSSSTSQIIAYDTTTFAEKFRINIGEKMDHGSTEFGPGTLVASHDGRYLAVTTPTTVRVLDVTVRATPTPTPTPGSTPGALPTISLSVSPTQVDEGGDIILTFSSSTTSSNPITISYSATGKAQQGIDYALSTVGHVTIPGGELSATVTLHALTDSLPEKNETIKLKLLKGAGYKLASAKKATVTIVNVP